MISVERTIISQYGNSPTLLRLIANMDAYLDPRADIDGFFNTIFNVDTAVGVGLDIWGRIVSIDRKILTNPVYYLDDEAYREIILLKALSNISATTSPAINQLLRNWTGDQRAYVNDLGQMQIRYTFEYILTPVQRFIIEQSDIFLRPAGVGARLVNSSFPVFGFREGGTRSFTGFNQAPFISEGASNAVE